MDFNASAGGLITRAGIVLNRRAERLLSQREWNKAVQMGLGRALASWIETYLALRWDKTYVRQMGYTGKSATPYFETGAFLRAAMAGAHPRVQATGGMARGQIRIPIPHPMAPDALRAFQTVPTQEARFVANAFISNVRAIQIGRAHV